MGKSLNNYSNAIAIQRENKLSKELNRWIRILITKYNPKEIILYGSLAQENVSDWSDIDLVIIKETDKTFFERIKEVLLLLEPKVGSDITVYTPEEFSELCKNNLFFQEEVLKNGVKLYEREH